MDAALWSEIPRIINKYRTWIYVRDTDRHEVFDVLVSGHIHQRQSRVLRLVARCPNGPYDKGQQWSVPEYELDRAIRHLQRHPDAAIRLANGAPSLTDVEFIIKVASLGFIDLELEYDAHFQ